MVKKEVWVFDDGCSTGVREGEILGEWILKEDFEARDIGRKVIRELVSAGSYLEEKDYCVTPMHILVGEEDVFLVREPLDSPEAEKKKLLYAFY